MYLEIHGFHFMELSGEEIAIVELVTVFIITAIAVAAIVLLVIKGFEVQAIQRQ